MKKGFYAILAALAVFALVMTACPTDEGTTTKPTPYQPNNNVTLNNITLGGGGEATQQTGSFGDTLAAITKPVEVGVSKAVNKAPGAEIVLNLSSSFKGVAKIVIKADGVAITEADFDASTAITYNYTAGSAKPKNTFTDKDQLYIKLTAENGTTVRYFGFTVGIGIDATLKSTGGITFSYTGKNSNNLDITVTFDVDTIGSPAKSVAVLDALPITSSELGKMQFPVKQPTNGFTTAFFTNDTDATVKFATKKNAEEADFADFDPKGGDQLIKFSDTDNAENQLYVKVTSENKSKVNYYKIVIVLKKTLKLNYGTPSNVNITSTGDPADSIWNSQLGTGPSAVDLAPWQLINRANPAEGEGYNNMQPELRSHGRAKLLWDEDGIWVYMQVWENHVSEVTGQHLVSSVELFVNENYNATSGDVTGGTNQNGGQYRLGANGERSGAPDAAVAAFNALGQFKAVKFVGGTSGNMPVSYLGAATNVKTGYVVIFQAPWRFPDKYPLADDREITVEIQINATGDGSEGIDGNKVADATRVGVLNWNNFTSNSYSSLKDYGEAILQLNNNQLGPQRPVISTPPASGKVELNATSLPTLSVSATSLDSGALTYQWYQVIDDVPTILTGSTAATLQLTSAMVDVTELGEYYFYVAVTNTVAGKPPKTVNSARATIVVFDPDAVVNTIEFVNSDATGWDNAKKGLFLDGKGSYGQFAHFPIKRLVGYTRLEVRFKVYTDTAGTTEETIADAPLSNLIRVVLLGSDGATVTGNEGTSGFGHNASGILYEDATVENKVVVGYYYTFTEVMLEGTYGGSAEFRFDNKGNKGSYLITSVLQVSGDPIELDLSKIIPDGRSALAAATYSAPNLTIVYTGNQNAFLEVPQVGRIKDVDFLRVTITGTSTGTANKYRVFLSHPTSGANWNGTNPLDGSEGAFSAVSNNTKNMTFGSNKNSDGNLTSFLITTGLAGGGNGFTSTETLTITKIVIDPVVNYVYE